MWKYSSFLGWLLIILFKYFFKKLSDKKIKLLMKKIVIIIYIYIYILNKIMYRH